MADSGKQVWFITGASSGFGKAFTEYAVKQGFNVVVTARRIEILNNLKDMAPQQIEAVKMDVNNKAEISHAVGTAIERFGQIDVLINNAGYGLVGAVEETSEAELRNLMETNFFGAIAVTQALIPHFRERKKGAIVNISSMGGQLSYAGFGAYSASKCALEGISEALALELAPFGVKVLIVEPGSFRTELMSGALKSMPEMGIYKESSGKTREFAKSMDGTQLGDPYKAAAAIHKALEADKTPLRLQLGKDAVDAIRQHSQTLLNDLTEWEHTAVNTAID